MSLTALALCRNALGSQYGFDFHGIWKAGEELALGRTPYIAPDAHALLVHGNAFIPPPPLAVLAIPFSIFPFGVAVALWNLTSVAALVAGLVQGESGSDGACLLDNEDVGHVGDEAPSELGEARKASSTARTRANRGDGVVKRSFARRRWDHGIAVGESRRLPIRLQFAGGVGPTRRGSGHAKSVVPLPANAIRPRICA
jgi:hypothetical protein